MGDVEIVYAYLGGINAEKWDNHQNKEFFVNSLLKP